MFEEKVLSPSQFPISNQSRVSTDVCCTVIGAVFALTMFVLSFVFWDKGNMLALFRCL